MKVTPEDLAVISEVVNSLAGRIEAQDRFDLRQDLCEKLLNRERSPKNLRSWVQGFAHLWVIHLFRDRRRDAELMKIAATSAKGHRTGPAWEPSWFPPHSAAREFAPFACHGARVMHVKAGSRPFRDVEKATADFLDSIGVWDKTEES